MPTCEIGPRKGVGYSSTFFHAPIFSCADFFMHRFFSFVGLTDTQPHGRSPPMNRVSRHAWRLIFRVRVRSSRFANAWTSFCERGLGPDVSIPAERSWSIKFREASLE